MSHGVPIVSYDYQYGPSELVKSEVNGVLVPLNNTNKMVDVISDLLTDSKKLQRLSDGAYAELDSIDNQATWQQWQPLINQTANK